MIFLDGGARPHTSNQTKQWLEQRKWEVLQHPPYSPDLAPMEFHLFRTFKEIFAGKMLCGSGGFAKHLLIRKTLVAPRTNLSFYTGAKKMKAERASV
ncbi:hypothetical protein AVEN_35674-1 [Araneus ventricosus]|uniref:Tc1-like transposase DDE domain-containing protein n=1 Tax=Araneus ventricosus TaxID=182803 RepID=A0A4Y2IXC5_ARAVE|nr:hypothetical protein AVEN_35674-1 [Araneus ventricosus]